MSISRALISVSDKTGLEALARGLHEHDIEILSTGGTAKFIADLDIPVVEVSDFTGFPELFDGRVKTLHPKVHGGRLHRRDLDEHVEQAEENDILPIDLVVVNLYPFEETVAKEGVTRSEAIEQIDIGGPSMLRSAAKNHDAVTVVVDPDDYEVVLSELEEHEGDTTLKTRERLAIKVFQRTAAYDGAIAAHLNDLQETESSFSLSLPLSQELRYGENPHQEAALYGNFADYFKQLQGKGLSYTNVIDIGAASELILEFRRPAVAILKHTNPCGVGADENDLRLAWEKAFEEGLPNEMRGVVLRTGFVLGRYGGGVKSLRRLVKLGLGGKVGNGRQGMSWVHQTDFNRIVSRAIECKSVHSIYNITSPQPVSNKEFMRALRQASNMPFGLNSPAFLVRFGARHIFKTDPELALYGRYVVPQRLLTQGFQFEYAGLDAALQSLKNL
ncbi:MAG: DUF1731 domain-containing protein [Verrucomicrobiales bacterium]|nr:DUF1731 domain-containing protein [Verrucomicrobiales bacterium]